MCPSAQPADLITVLHGRVWCPVQGDLDAVAIRGDLVIAVDAAALALADTPGPAVAVVAAGLPLPASRDAPAGEVFAGLQAHGPHISDAGSVAEVVAQVARWAAEHPHEPWIRGASYDPALAPDGLFDARWLDEAVPDRPVVLRAADYHTVWVNTMALHLAGIDASTPAPPLGEIARRADGTPLGTLREWGAVDLVLDVAGPHPLDVRVRALEESVKRTW